MTLIESFSVYINLNLIFFKVNFFKIIYLLTFVCLIDRRVMNFNNSSIKITGMLNTSIAFHYVYSIGHTILQGLACCNTFVGTPKGVMANMFAKNGIYIISKCNSIDEAIANNNHTFDEGRVMSND